MARSATQAASPTDTARLAYLLSLNMLIYLPTFQYPVAPLAPSDPGTHFRDKVHNLYHNVRKFTRTLRFHKVRKAQHLHVKSSHRATSRAVIPRYALYVVNDRTFLAGGKLQRFAITLDHVAS